SSSAIVGRSSSFEQAGSGEKGGQQRLGDSSMGRNRESRRGEVAAAAPVLTRRPHIPVSCFDGSPAGKFPKRTGNLVPRDPASLMLLIVLKKCVAPGDRSRPDPETGLANTVNASPIHAPRATLDRGRLDGRRTHDGEERP